MCFFDGVRGGSHSKGVRQAPRYEGVGSETIRHPTFYCEECRKGAAQRAMWDNLFRGFSTQRSGDLTVGIKSRPVPKKKTRVV